MRPQIEQSVELIGLNIGGNDRLDSTGHVGEISFRGRVSARGRISLRMRPEFELWRRRRASQSSGKFLPHHYRAATKRPIHDPITSERVAKGEVGDAGEEPNRGMTR
jgi:hypothetical protein